MNRSGEPARTLLLFSSSRAPAFSVYPDSDTIGVWAGDEENDLVFRRGTAVPWSHGEDGSGAGRTESPNARVTSAQEVWAVGKSGQGGC